MNYAEICDSVQNIRGDFSYRSSAGGITDAIRAREAEVWLYADWPIKQSAQLTLNVVGGTATVALPAGFNWTTQALQIINEWGDRLDYLDTLSFFERYGASAASPPSSAAPEAWTLLTDQIRLGPTPQSSASFTVSGWNLPIKRSDPDTWTLGTMSVDSDLPWWPDDYHDFLVDGAIATIKRRFGDPSWPPDEQVFRAGLDSLAHELAPAIRNSLEIWGEC